MSISVYFDLLNVCVYDNLKLFFYHLYDMNDDVTPREIVTELQLI